MEKLHNTYIVRCQYPGKLAFLSFNMVLPYDHTEEDFVEHCKVCIQRFIPEGFFVQSVYLDRQGYSEGKTIWDSGMRNND